MINLSHQHGPVLINYLSGTTSQCLVISPFINCDTLAKLLENSSNVIIVTSWRADHLVQGVSSLDLYPLSKEKGWKLYIHNRIHAKIYSMSLSSCYLGSANCTENALFDPNGNIECMMYCPELSTYDRHELNRLLHESKLVDDRVYDTFVKWYEKLDKINISHECGPDLEEIDTFSIFNLPATDNPELLWDYQKTESADRNDRVEHDFAIFGPVIPCNSREVFMQTISDIFFKSPFVMKALEQITDEGISFGAMSAWIQNNCADVPVPYRKDIKVLVHNLFCWVEMLAPEKYRILVPGKHSQVLFKINDSP